MIVLVPFLIAVIKTMVKINLWASGFIRYTCWLHIDYSKKLRQELKAGENQEIETEVEIMSNDASLLSSQSLFSFLFYTTQENLSRAGIKHSRLGFLHQSLIMKIPLSLGYMLLCI